MTITRRQVRVLLGLLWLIDGVLQLQPFMFTSGFSRAILAPAAEGQPSWVAGPVHLLAGTAALHPALFNTLAAFTQLALAAGLLLRRGTRTAILASVAWSIGVWWFGEGLGGLASGHASLLTGAPGAAVLYAVLAAASWPHPPISYAADDPDAPAAWLPWVWAGIWVGGAVLPFLSGQNQPDAVAVQIRDVARSAPGWLAATNRVAADVLAHTAAGGLALCVAVMAAVGLGVLIPGRVRTAAACIGAGVAVLIWFAVQNLGQLYSGQATDPNSGPLLILFAVAVAHTMSDTTRQGTRTRFHSHTHRLGAVRPHRHPGRAPARMSHSTLKETVA